MPASEHMVVIEKNRRIMLRMLTMGGTPDRPGKLQPLKAEKRRLRSDYPGKGHPRIDASRLD